MRKARTPGRSIDRAVRENVRAIFERRVPSGVPAEDLLAAAGRLEILAGRYDLNDGKAASFVT